MLVNGTNCVLTSSGEQTDGVGETGSETLTLPCVILCGEDGRSDMQCVELLKDLRSKYSTWLLIKLFCLHTERVILWVSKFTCSFMRSLMLPSVFNTDGACLSTCSGLMAGASGELYKLSEELINTS